MGGNKASDSSHMLSIHGQSSLCPVSSFKLKTEAAFSTARKEKSQCKKMNINGLNKSRKSVMPVCKSLTR